MNATILKKRPHRLMIYVVFLPMLIELESCKKFVAVDPPSTDLISSTVFINDANATAAVVGIYSQIMESISGFASGGIQSFTTLGGLSADELLSPSSAATLGEFYTNSIKPTNPTIAASWTQSYRYIFFANSILEGLAKSSGVSASTKKQLEGEAKFIRAWLHFHLVNYWGDVPYITTTDHRVNALQKRLPSADVYQRIIVDLTEAQTLLSQSLAGNTERIRPDKWTATALLARVYLFNKDWPKAEAEANVLLNNPLFSLQPDVNAIFLKNSTETIWQLKPVIPDYNASEGYNFILKGTPQNTALHPVLVTSFEPGDKRKESWIDSIQVGSNRYYFAAKYKIKGGNPGTLLKEYSIVFRLAEQYLIRAEALANQNKLAAALSDINLLRSRASLPALSGLTQAALLLQLEKERRAELFTEWGGFRWMDLKRTNRDDAVLNLVKAPNWQLTDRLYPLPQTEIQKDPNLAQNPGY